MRSKSEAVSAVVRELYPRQYSKWLGQQQVKNVPQHLDRDEWPEAVLFGTLSITGMGTHGGLWATNKRLLWIHRGFLGLNWDVRSYAYDRISAVELSLFPGAHSLLIHLPGETLANPLLRGIDSKAAKKFAKVVQVKVGSSPTPARAESAVQSEEPDLVTKLQQLGQLREQGVLAEEEFQAIKQKLLK